MPKYYALETVGKNAELYIFGDITSFPWTEKDRDAYGVVKELQELDADEISVHINSYGGDVAEGLAIYNVLSNNKAKITTYCDGFACSAASVIFMAGDERIMNSASLLMIHNAWSYGCGNAAEFRKRAEDLDKITQASVNAYLSRVSISEEDIKKKMDEESWLTAAEALEDGFATKVLEPDESGVSQSAFSVIRGRLLMNPRGQTLEDSGVSDATADIIAEKIFAKLKKTVTKEQQKEREVSTGWGAFFREGGKRK